VQQSTIDHCAMSQRNAGATSDLFAEQQDLDYVTTGYRQLHTKYYTAL